MNIKLYAFIGNCAIIVALVIGLLATRSTLADVKHERAMTEARLAVSNSSIERLEQRWKRKLDEERRLASDDAARIAASKQAVQMANAVAKVRQAAIDRLNQSAVEMAQLSVEGQCEASPELLKEWPA